MPADHLAKQNHVLAAELGDLDADIAGGGANGLGDLRRRLGRGAALDAHRNLRSQQHVPIRPNRVVAVQTGVGSDGEVDQVGTAEQIVLGGSQVAVVDVAFGLDVLVRYFLMGGAAREHDGNEDCQPPPRACQLARLSALFQPSCFF